MRFNTSDLQLNTQTSRAVFMEKVKVYTLLLLYYNYYWATAMVI